jgi:hypothetical protein
MRRRLLVLSIVVALVTVGGMAHAAFTATTVSSGNTVATAASFTSCDYPATVSATSGIVSYWRLGETSGTTAADRQGRNPGTYSGGVTRGAAGAVAGDPNTAAVFDGVDDYVNVPDSVSLKPATQISLEAWVKPNAGIPTYASVATKTTVNTWSDGYGMYAWEGGIDFWVNDDAQDVWTDPIPTTVWSHVVGTYDGSTIRIYLNGVLVDSFAYSSPLVHLIAPLRIGDAAGTGNYHWAGGIDDVAVYNTALSAATVADHFRCGHRYRDLTVNTAGLQSYWRLGEPAGTVALDSKATNSGSYANGVSLGATGALTVTGDKAVSFDGSNDHVDLGDVYDFTGTASFTVSCWFDRTAVNAGLWRRIIGKNNGIGTREGWALGIAPSTAGTAQRVQFSRFSAGSADVLDATTATVAGTWYHVAASYDGVTMRLYLNGVLEASVASSRSMVNTTHPLRIGNISDTAAEYFAGSIDEVAVFGRALTADEVKEAYQSR